MSERTNVRLVICPNCENLLPELTDYSAYICGGCGSVLRAENKGVDLNTLSEKSDEERTYEVPKDKKPFDRYEKMMKHSKNRMDSSDGSESNVRSAISSSSRSERRPVLRTRGESRRTIVPRKDEHNFNVLEAELIQDEERSHDHQLVKGSQDFDDLEIYHDKKVQGLQEVEGYWRSQKTEDAITHYGKPGPSTRSVHDYDRDELLKQLDELKDRLKRSGKEKIPPDREMAYQDPHEFRTNRVPMQNPYHNQKSYNGSPHPMHRQELGSGGFYPPRFDPRYRSGPYPAPVPYHAPPPSRAYKSGPYMDDGMMYMDDPNFSSHHPSFSNYPKDHIFIDYHDRPSLAGDYRNRRFTDPPPLRSFRGQMHERGQSGMSLEVDGFDRRGSTRAPLSWGGRMCHPIGYGAPFFTCKNCSELLLLPKNVRSDGNNSRRKKVSCGSCSAVIAFTVVDNKLVFVSEVEPEDSNSNYLKVERSKKITFSSDDCDNSGYDACSNKSGEIKSRVSSCKYISDAEEDKWSSMSKDENGSQHHSGSSLQDHFEYSNKFHRGSSRSGEGSKGGFPDNEKVISNENVDKNEQILRKESATETELSSNEFPNTGTTFDSGEGSNIAAKMLLSDIEFSDSNRSNEEIEPEKAKVTVNGVLIPRRLIKKAEKVAGPVQPGNYWYDFRAGFWGAIGGPCLGIIPPFIGEFNHPMPEHCAAGNTNVFVNGRELNQKDLNLLVFRGLPKERDRSYIIEISGRVLDDDTGEELQSLGKLAPTVERKKHGFGMRPPKTVS